MISITPSPPNSPSSRDVTTTTLTLSGLADYTNYTFTVAAYNTGGVGPASLTMTVRTAEGGNKFAAFCFMPYNKIICVAYNKSLGLAISV